MYYELYLDVLFFTNLWMDYLILVLTNRLLKKTPNRIRCFLGGAAGALGVCLLLILPVRKSIAILLPAYVVTSTWMVKIGCKIKDIRDWIRCTVTLYLVTFLWGGMFFALYQTPAALHLRTFLFLSTISYEVLSLAFWFYRRQARHRDHYCDVTLHVNDKSKKVRGLYDTGNSLVDTLTGKPVSVIDAACLESLFFTPPEYNEALKPHYIPYHAIGTEHGVLLTITIESMVIDRHGEMQVIPQPVLALSQGNVSFTQHYQLILNPNLIDS